VDGRFVRDLVALSGLPAIWTRANPAEIAESLAQLILSVTEVDCVCLVLADPDAEVLRWHSRMPPTYPVSSTDFLKLKDGDCTITCGDIALSGRLARFPLGRGAGSVLIAFCRREDFPTEEERVILRLAVNQAGIAIERWRIEEELRRQTQTLKRLNQVGTIVAGSLDTQAIIQAVTDAATELSGAQFGAFFYNVTDEAGERYMLYTLAGAPRHAFSNFPLPRNTEVFDPTFRGKGVVRSPNIRKDPRYGKSSPYHGTPPGHLPVVSYLAVPVVSGDGTVHGGLFFGHEKEAVFTDQSEEIVRHIAAHAAVALDNARLYQAARAEIAARERIQGQQKLLLAELNHRVKNTLAVVQSVAAQTMRHSSSAEAFQTSFLERLAALANTHNLLSDANWVSVSLSALIEFALSPFSDPAAKRFHVEGISVALNAQQAVGTALVIHELATNCLKYGSLSTPGGTVTIQMRKSELPNHAIVCWEEIGGPPVSPPRHSGFGSRLILRFLAGAPGESAFEFRPDGVVCKFAVRICSEQEVLDSKTHASELGIQAV
jgi:two-component sensor histidine kinase